MWFKTFAFEQNCTHTKEKVGQCDKTPLLFFFIFTIFLYQGRNEALCQNSAKYTKRIWITCWFWYFFSILVTAAILDSQSDPVLQFRNTCNQIILHMKFKNHGSCSLISWRWMVNDTERTTNAERFGIAKSHYGPSGQVS